MKVPREIAGHPPGYHPDQRLERWLAWSGSQYPDDSPGDVIAYEKDGAITLDDGVTTWNPLRALAAAIAELEQTRKERDEWRRQERLAVEQARIENERCEAAKDEAARLREALEQIRDHTHEPGWAEHAFQNLQSIARAALEAK